MSVLAEVLASSHTFPTYLFEPLWGWGYQAWSGILSDLGELTLITALFAGFWKTKKHLECDVEDPPCHRKGRPVHGTGHKACRLHHPNAQDRKTGLTSEDIRDLYEKGTK